MESQVVAFRGLVTYWLLEMVTNGTLILAGLVIRGVPCYVPLMTVIMAPLLALLATCLLTAVNRALSDEDRLRL